MNEISTSLTTPPFLPLPMITESRQTYTEDRSCEAYSTPILYKSDWREFHERHAFDDTRYRPLLSALAEFSPITNLRYSSSITAEIEHVICGISGLVVIPRPGEIREYLLRFPDIISILPCICFHTAMEFTTNDQISLELFRDRESEDRYLTLNIRQNTYAKDIMKQLERIWLNFESEIAKSKGWINITTDFRSPR